jgi:hypothetical protein
MSDDNNFNNFLGGRGQYPQTTKDGSKLCFNEELIIANGQTLSNEIDLNGANIIAISIPAGFVGEFLQFYIWDGQEFKKAYAPDRTADILMRMKVLPNSAYPMVAADCASFQKIKLESDLPQTADTTIRLVCRFLL